MNKIEAGNSTLREILSGAKYSIDYYQREYLWGRDQVSDLLNDLCDKFLDTHDSNVGVGQVPSKYERYFIGSIIICEEEEGEQKYIVDGQQRLTTLTLILIYIRHRLLEIKQNTAHIEPLISAYIPPNHTFVLDVDERIDCMEALYSGNKESESFEANESTRNIFDRYQDIEENFPTEIDNEAIIYFSSWLIYNVDLIKIEAKSSDDAYTIFETMNDRGLSLTSVDMLKGYLLTKVMDHNYRSEANEIWRNRMSQLKLIGKNEDSSAITAWMRGKYAVTMRERGKGAADQDFELVATQCHRWIGSQAEKLGLRESKDYFDMIKYNFSFYTKWYMFIREKSMDLSNDFPHIYYNAQNNFTLQYPVLLAPLNLDDSEDTISEKIAITSKYLDIVLARRIWNNRQITQDTMRYNMYRTVILEIRNKSISELRHFFIENLTTQGEGFASNQTFGLNRQNRWKLHRLLARMADYLEIEVMGSSRYCDFTEHEEDPYQIEHIWANHFINHDDDFEHQAEFQEYRNHIGGLLLLPRSSNASLGDMIYPEKVEYYSRENLLAASLCEITYSHNPNFARFIKESSLPFRPYTEFKKADLDERQELYLALAEKVWDPKRLEQ